MLKTPALIFLILSGLLFFTCKEKEEDKFHYTSNKAFYFKYPENDSISQILSMKRSSIFRQEKNDTLTFLFSWRNKICRLKDLKDVKIKLTGVEEEGESGKQTGKRTEIHCDLINMVIYKDYPNTPYKIKRIPLNKLKDCYYGDMFLGLENEFDDNQYLNFDFESSHVFANYPPGYEMEITVTWKDGEQILKSTLARYGYKTYKTRFRPYG
ncbi:MAG: hypothetical protein Q8M29_19560 [Bacteroidota bacterium]|nr:hypothetical protein [Bacteroidota bacterium]